MKIRRFVAGDIREAMRQVREALGPDAVILETQRVEGGIELAAAIDYPEPAPMPAAAAAPAVPPPAAATGGGGLPAPVTALADEREFRRLREEVHSLRELLESQLSRLAWNDNVRRNAAATAAMRNLSRLGVTPDVVRDVVGRLGTGLGERSVWSAPLKALEQSIPFAEDDLIAAGGVFAVVGPTGVGKTTTIAKLAARYALTGALSDIALVTTDTFRIGARDQLETFGEILGTPVYQAGDSARLAEVLRMLAGRRLVLIDTTGMGQRDVRLARQLSWLAGADPRVKVLLALPAPTQTAALQEIVDAFMVSRPSACILTKTDEATSLGGAISALIRSRLPLAYVTNGQRVPEDLHFARPRQTWLVKSALELMSRQDQMNEDDMAEQFAEVHVDACA
ncbi:MAG: flagellar biosynthesis protein FlhF [Gammaproteobacteria bacterium]|nr:flagellar biosynthesis protein FlhF [Gammaproteobacteria bacterium]